MSYRKANVTINCHYVNDNKKFCTFLTKFQLFFSINSPIKHNVTIKGHALYYVAQALFREHKLIEKFKIEERKLHNFLTLIESGYRPDNPYHNSIHAADVALSVNFLIHRIGIHKCILFFLRIFFRIFFEFFFYIYLYFFFIFFCIFFNIFLYFFVFFFIFFLNFFIFFIFGSF